MKKMHWLEWIGFVIFILGFILKLVGDLVESPPAFLTSLINANDIMYWLGLGMWALGYMMREKEEKKSK